MDSHKVQEPMFPNMLMILDANKMEDYYGGSIVGGRMQKQENLFKLVCLAINISRNFNKLRSECVVVPASDLIELHKVREYKCLKLHNLMHMQSTIDFLVDWNDKSESPG